MAALDKPTEGIVFLQEKDLSKVKEKEMAAFRRNNLGFVFQDFNLLDTFSLKDNIFLPLVLSGTSYKEMERRLIPLADKLGIKNILEKYPYEVSGGQKQRAAVARAVITQPQLLLADEPTETDVTSSQDNQDGQPDAGQSSDGNYQSQTEQTDFPEPDTAMLVNLRGDTTTVYKLADGRYMDRTNTVYTFDGVDTWTDESGVEWNETAQTSEAEENVQDPYDLYSWDPETGTYIPYQQADGNGEAIGRGNGWYYYDDEAGAYIPW